MTFIDMADSGERQKDHIYRHVVYEYMNKLIYICYTSVLF